MGKSAETAVRTRFEEKNAAFIPTVEGLGIDPYRGDNPITVEQAKVLLREYDVTEIWGGTGARESDQRAYYNYILIHAMRNTGTSPDAIAYVLMPLLSLWYGEPYISGVTGWKGLDIITSGLANPNCPESVLSYACYHACWHYAWQARKHPNCPVEDQIAVWLRWSETQAEN